MEQDEASQRASKQSAQHLWAIYQDLDRAYERYAHLQGLSYTSLTVLDQVYRDHLDNKTCTQRSICDETHLPKQTVNSIVRDFCRNGMFELVEVPYDHRAKAIHLTAGGLAYARRIIDPIDNAEEFAFSQFTDGERAQFFSTLSRFATLCADQLREFETTGQEPSAGRLPQPSRTPNAKDASGETRAMTA